MLFRSPQRIEETDDSAVCDYLSDSELVIISGSNENVIHHLAANGCKILYDVGWSNDLSLDALIPVLRSVAVFSPNEKEALKMTCTARAEDALKILSRVVRHPIIKLGARGALLWQDGGRCIFRRRRLYQWTPREPATHSWAAWHTVCPGIGVCRSASALATILAERRQQPSAA